MILSAAVHLAAVLFVLWTGTRLMEADRAPGSGHGRGGGGGGGGNRTLVLLVPPAPAAPAAPALAPPAPAIVMPQQPAVVIPEVRPDTTPRAPAPAQPVAGQGPGEGPGKGAGAGPGSGTGSGGGSGSGVGPGTGPDSGGEGGRIYSAQPLGIIMPPLHPPSSLRGTTLTAVFEISATGEVVHVALDPTPKDRTFANEFLERLRRYTFTPAHMVDGQPVATLFRINFTL